MHSDIWPIYTDRAVNYKVKIKIVITQQVIEKKETVILELPQAWSFPNTIECSNWPSSQPWPEFGKLENPGNLQFQKSIYEGNWRDIFVPCTQ